MFFDWVHMNVPSKFFELQHKSFKLLLLLKNPMYLFENASIAFVLPSRFHWWFWPAPGLPPVLALWLAPGLQLAPGLWSALRLGSEPGLWLPPERRLAPGLWLAPKLQPALMFWPALGLWTPGSYLYRGPIIYRIVTLNCLACSNAKRVWVRILSRCNMSLMTFKTATGNASFWGVFGPFEAQMGALEP